MRIKLWKSKREIEWERKTRLRKTKVEMNRYIENCRRLRKSYEKNAIQARRLENLSLTKRFVAKMHILETQIKRMNMLQLLLSDVELSRQQAGLFGSMADTIKDFAKVMEKEEISAQMAAELDKNLNVVFDSSERIDSMLTDVLESMNQKILGEIGPIDEEEIEKILESVEEKAGVYETEKIDSRLKVNNGYVHEQEKDDVVEDNTSRLSDLDKRIERGLKKINRQK